MTDLAKLLAEIQRPETSHVDMLRRHSCGTLQWFLENDVKTHPIHNRNQLEFLVCGEDGFASIEQDLRAATSSIDLVLWGFDPGMELVRAKAGASNDAGLGSAQWPRGTTYGDLLTQKAREGVKVRMLLWYDSTLLNKATGNTPDLPLAWLPAHFASSDLVAPTHDWLKNRTFSRKQLAAHRADYCTAWWRAALSGRFPNLEVRMRKAQLGAITANIAKYLPDQVALIEDVGRKLAGTHHQKPVLIDYEPGKGKPNTCAYVMGLNSVTDYWDTAEHLYNDPRREVNFAAGAAWKESVWYVKPYRDYAIRVQGEALYNINENFVQGWDNAQSTSLRADAPSGASGGSGSNGLQAQRRSIQPKDIPAPPGARHRAQIVRTQPEKLDATILKAYTLASSNAVNYIYVENQYFQLADWPQFIKKIRGQYRDGMKAAKANPADLTPLHLFVVMPQPERGQMVPRTYETVGQLGAAESMGAYNNKVQGQRKADALEPPKPPPEGVHPFEQAEYNRRLHDWLGERSANDSATVRDSVKAVPANPKAELEALGIKPLVAMLMTYDAGNEAKDIRISQRDSEAQEAQAEQEANAKDNKSHKASDVDDYGVDIMPKRYREIYIHSKLMFVDDVYTTLGSANFNARSMVSDSEFNICTADYDFTQGARRRVWENIAGSDLDGGDGGLKAIADAHYKWSQRMKGNKAARQLGKAPENGSFIHPFEDPRGEPLVRLA
jgi:phosphatidylserine/phosphatidylglycerophosphate/cardiolipin synthase-like enzyme